MSESKKGSPQPLRASVEVCASCAESTTEALGEGTYWFADNDLWNEVNGSPNGFLCPRCFTAAASERGIAIGWRAGRVGEVEDA